MSNLTTNTVARLRAALDEACRDCGCTVLQRAGGHRIECRAPHWQALLDEQPDEPRVRHDMYGYTCPDCGETAQMDDAHRCKSKVTDEMVNRFLSWPLPENFQPDAGISFNPEYNIEYNAARGLPPARHQPTGTNLFDYGQAKAMLEHVLGGKQPPTKAEKPIYGLSGQGEKP